MDIKRLDPDTMKFCLHASRHRGPVIDPDVPATGDFVTGLPLPRPESDLLFLWLRLSHELPDRLKDNLKAGVIFLLQRFKLAGQVFMRSQNVAQSDEGPHDLNVDLNGPFASKNRGQHRHPLLGEGIRSKPPAAPT